MGIYDWNWKLPADKQDYPWDCAACSTAWALRTVGQQYTELEVIVELGPDRISPVLGLHDATGGQLANWLSDIGVPAENNPDASWGEVMDAAGYQPMLIGGRNWGHWVAVRMGSAVINADSEYPALWLMNPAPGYMGVEQYLDPDHFDYLGPFSAVWFTGWPQPVD